jgi:hypothetical protein
LGGRDENLKKIVNFYESTGFRVGVSAEDLGLEV